jgi:DNA polymerase III subunit delta
MPKAKARSTSATSNIHAVIGSDEGDVKRVAAELAKKLAPSEAGEFGLEVIDGMADRADQAARQIQSTIEALQTLPFFGGTKVVWLKNANFLADDKMSNAAVVQSGLEELITVLETGLESNVTFLISAIDVDKRRSFYKTLGRCANLQVIDRLDSNKAGWEEAAIELVQSRARKQNLEFDDDALNLFVLLTGGDTRQIENELEKIDLYLGRERHVSAELVRALVPLSRAGVIFELSNALAARELDRALALIRRLLEQGEKPMGILVRAILPTIRNLLLAKDLMERHRIPPPSVPYTFGPTLNRLPEDATRHLPRKKDGSVSTYQLGIAAQRAHEFTREELIAGLEACLEANVRIVTTQLDHELILTETVVKMIGEPNVRAPSAVRSR